MPTKLPENYDSDSHTGAQLSTFRNTDSVSIHGGSFSMTSTTAEQRTHMDSGKLHLHGLKLTPICVYSKGGLKYTVARLVGLVAHQDFAIKGGLIPGICTRAQGTLDKTDMILNRH